MKQTIKNPVKNDGSLHFVLDTLIFFIFVEMQILIFRTQFPASVKRGLGFLLLVSLLSTMPPGKKPTEAYLFAYYSGDGGSGLHLAWSEDGRHFQVLKKGKSFLKPGVGDYLFLDPALTQTPDGIFHLVWAPGPYRRQIAYAWSRNLIDWSPQSLIRIMEKDSVILGLGGPELNFDEAAGRFSLSWSCTVPGKFPATAENNDSLPGGYMLNPRVYRKLSSNLSEWSPSELWFDPGHPVSDASIVRDSSRVFLFYKDASNFDKNIQLNVKMVKGFSVSGTFANENPVMASRRTHAEAPAAMRLDSNFILYYQRFKTGKIGASITRDFKKWKDYSDSVSFPKGAKHGSVLKVHPKIVSRLRSLEDQ